LYALGSTRKNPASHKALPPDQRDPLPQGQASLTKWLNSGDGLMVVAARRQLDDSVGGGGLTVVAAQQWQRQRLEGGNGSTVVADTAMAEDRGQ
jgi:hypothetical protein